MNNEIINKIKHILDKIRPFLISDGGNVEFVKYEKNILYVKMTGACMNCPLADITLEDNIKEIIFNEIPEVKDVININN